MIQGSAGRSTNMNANEVIANRALELLNQPRGQYDVISPNSHVNLSQSTNDVYPTAIRVALHWSISIFRDELARLVGIDDPLDGLENPEETDPPGVEIS